MTRFRYVVLESGVPGGSTSEDKKSDGRLETDNYTKVLISDFLHIFSFIPEFSNRALEKGDLRKGCDEEYLMYRINIQGPPGDPSYPHQIEESLICTKHLTGDTTYYHLLRTSFMDVLRKGIHILEIKSFIFLLYN